jgi:hypothetical protein
VSKEAFKQKSPIWKSCLGQLARRYALEQLFLLQSLPSYIIFDAELTGVLPAYFLHNRIPQGSQDYMYEEERRRWYNYMSIPDLPMENMAADPYWIPKLHNWNWHVHLNLARCSVGKPDCTNGMWNEFQEPIDKLSRFEEFCRKRGSKDPLHHWIYVSEWAILSEFEPWNKAFIDLLQYHYRRAPAHNVTFHLLDCSEAKFLCHIWAVRGLSMIHITSKESSSDLPRSIDPMSDSRDLQLAVLVVELPLEDKLQGTLATFPSQFEQLRRLTSSENVYLEFDEYEEEQQLENRFVEWIEEKRGGGPLGWLRLTTTEKSSWLLGRNDVLKSLWEIALLVSTSTALLVLEICLTLKELLQMVFSWFLPGPQQRLAEPPGDFLSDFMEGAFMDFLEEVKNNLTEEMLSKTTSMAEGSSIIDEALGSSIVSNAPTG